MGGFTKVVLENKTITNIRKQNEILKELGLAKKYRFYSEDDVRFEYEGFCNNDGSFPEHRFPRDEIKSYEDFKKYWNTNVLGEIFVPKFGTLTFDCYFGRTSQNAMRRIAKYVIENHLKIEYVSGSWTTFIERGMSKRQCKKLKELNIKVK